MVIADTGFFIALLNKNDASHRQAVQALRGVREPLITTVPVLTETCYILLVKLGPQAPIRFLRSLDDGLAELVQFTPEDLERSARLMQKYSKLPMDLADASLVLLAESLGHGRILSTDRRDFHAYRWKSTKPFTNLMAEAEDLRK